MGRRGDERRSIIAGRGQTGCGTGAPARFRAHRSRRLYAPACVARRRVAASNADAHSASGIAPRTRPRGARVRRGRVAASTRPRLVSKRPAGCASILRCQPRIFRTAWSRSARGSRRVRFESFASAGSHRPAGRGNATRGTGCTVGGVESSRPARRGRTATP
jgi:hypothetical protein